MEYSKGKINTKQLISINDKNIGRPCKDKVEEEKFEISLKQTIEKQEKVDSDKLKLAEEIGYKSIPDKIINTDQYGFIKDDIEDKKKTEELLKINARIEKWNYMLSHFEYYKLENHRNKLKERGRKGIPDNIRSYAWQKLVNFDDYYKKDLYQSLSDKECNKNIESVIIKDIDRTFPKCQFFREKYGNGQRQLYKVLSNYSKYNQEVGYVQGMGFIAALLLTYMDEESSFFMLDALMKKYQLEKMYLPGFPDLRKKFYVLLNLEKKYINKIYQIFKKNDIYPSTYASEWFLCLFSRNLKFNVLVRIFDCFLIEGFKIIYRFALAFLKSKENEFVSETGIDSIFNTLGKCFSEVKIDELFKIAFGYRFHRKEIENFEIEYEKIKDRGNNNEFMNQL